MIIIPAIDLIDGNCVRLEKGDFTRKQIYSANPLEAVFKFEAEGAEYLHIVDLDGAKDSNSSQSEIIKSIAGQTSLKIQTGGGIRSGQTIEDLLNAGIERVVIGSLAVRDPVLVKSWIKAFGAEKIVLALDVRVSGGIPEVSLSGWQEDSNLSLWRLLDDYGDATHLLCTDIDRDGMLLSPNFELYQEIIQRYPAFALQASGGVASLEDLRKLSEIKADSAIVGKALYENRFTLSEAMNAG